MRLAKRVVVVAVCAVLAAGSARAADKKAAAKDSAAAAALKQDMRKLWTDHVVWTRDYIVAAVGDQPDAQAAATRLMKNQDDIGGA
ncbi:MAG: glycosyltransferase, partial [Acidobacteria bacterium]